MRPVQRAHLASLLCLGMVPGMEGRGADVELRVPDAAGEPGTVVAVEFRATVREPVGGFLIHFDLDAVAADFIAAEVEGTASAHAPRNIVAYNPAFFRGGYQIGVRFNLLQGLEPVPPGDDLVLVKGIFRIRPEAAEGDYPVRVIDNDFTSANTISMEVSTGEPGSLSVEAPSGPRPVGSLSCSQEGSEAVLTWEATQTYDAVAIRRNGRLVATVGGAATTYRERPPIGPATYTVTAVQAGRESLPSICTMLVEAPRPSVVRDLSCQAGPEAVSLSWTNGAPYESIALLRNGRLVATLAGDRESYTDPFHSELFTVYTVIGRAGGVESLPTSCALNEFSDVYTFRAEVVEASPGARTMVRVFGTNPTVSQAFSLGLRIDPALGRIRELSLEDTASEHARFDFFQYQRHVLNRGETAAAVGFDLVPPFGNRLAAGADQHLLTVVIDVLPDVAPGTLIPVEIGEFGEPPASNVYAIDLNPDDGIDFASSVAARVESGAILVGRSPVPPVEEAAADIVAGGEGGGAAEGPAESGIHLRWTNPAAYDAIRIERGGEVLAEIGGGEVSYLDRDAGPGRHHYRTPRSCEGGRASRCSSRRSRAPFRGLSSGATPTPT